MKLKTYYLKFTAPLHIGNYKPNTYDQSELFLRSDTIVAAILNTWAFMGNSQWIDDCEGNPSFTISSAFPYTQQNNDVITHFFPRPKLIWNREYDSTLSKKIKKVQWLDQHFFERLINGEKMDDLGANNNQLQADFLSKNQLQEAISTKEIQSRVTIPRIRIDNEDPTPFYMERIRFREGDGLYFLAEGDDFERLETALDLLQYEGFGTDRNVGNGSFEWFSDNIELRVPVNTNYQTNLGLYVPKNGLTKALDNRSSFSIIRRGGWITKAKYNTKQKNSIYMLEEGSILKGNSLIKGNGSIELTPPILENAHKIYRSGKTIFIPVKPTNQ